MTPPCRTGAHCVRNKNTPLTRTNLPESKISFFMIFPPLWIYHDRLELHPGLAAIQRACEARRAAVGHDGPAKLPVDKVEPGCLPGQHLQRNPVYTAIRSGLKLTGVQPPAQSGVEKTLVTAGGPGMPALSTVSR